MRLLSELKITSLLAEYFQNLDSGNLAKYSRLNLLNFLIMISEQKKYRPYIVNKGILMFLKKIFDTERKDKKTRDKITQIISRIGSYVNPQSFSYSVQHFIFEILCYSIEASFHELTIFESLLG